MLYQLRLLVIVIIIMVNYALGHLLLESRRASAIESANA